MSSRSLGGGLALCISCLLGLPAGAAALTASISRPCYAHVPTRGSQPIIVTLAGGTPNADFIVSATAPGESVGSAGFTSGTFDALGDGTAQILDVAPPSLTVGPTRGQRIALSVTDFGAGTTDVPIGHTLVTTFAMSISSHPRSPRARRRVTVSGTPFARRRLYGFVTNPRGTRVLRRFFLGIGDVCGFASTRAVVAPSDFHGGVYRLYVNAGARLDKRRALYLPFEIN